VKKKLKSLAEIFLETGKKFTEDRATRLAAGLAYYTLFSLAPLLIILTGIAGRFLDDVVTSEEIPEVVERVVGPEAAEWITGLVEGGTLFSDSSSFTIAAIISLLVMIWGAANIFNHIKETLNFIWGVRAAPGRRGIIATIRGRLLAFLTVFFFGLLIVGFFLLNTVVAYIIPQFEAFILESTFLTELFPEAVETFTETILPSWRIIQWVQYILAFALMMLVFAFFYKFMPDVHIAWRDVWVGAAFTALLITIGTLGLSIYFRLSSIGSLYGAAGTIMVVLFWFYYSAQMFLIGAEFTEVYAKRYGSEIRPSNNAVAFEVVLEQKKGADSSDASSVEGADEPSAPLEKEAELDSSATSSR
jgi:membrane protein